MNFLFVYHQATKIYLLRFRTFTLLPAKTVLSLFHYFLQWTKNGEISEVTDVSGLSFENFSLKRKPLHSQKLVFVREYQVYSC
ncbi:hypothetical protein Npun_R0715 [Nostoc punctiforme PCC 73102]|uniref:Uncharacterized protein n=1 Tax=Nostoc punctiforme (strain ATCC 29133 / PCC 73102) TaxID=63737 RepID=B2J9G8_NOSP7|nr:hypothetical protein Npun_R0715 [Nostoc punctiforme PCC 73102]